MLVSVLHSSTFDQNIKRVILLSKLQLTLEQREFDLDGSTYTRTSQLTCTIQTRLAQRSDGSWESAHAEGRLKFYADFPLCGQQRPLKLPPLCVLFRGHLYFKIQDFY